MYDDVVVCSYRRNCLRFMHVCKQMVGASTCPRIEGPPHRSDRSRYKTGGRMFALSANLDLYIEYEDFSRASVLKRFVCLPAGGFFCRAWCCTDQHWQTDASYVRRKELAIFYKYLPYPSLYVSRCFLTVFFCLIQVNRCGGGQDGRMSSEFIRIDRKNR